MLHAENDDEWTLVYEKNQQNQPSLDFNGFVSYFLFKFSTCF